MGGKKKKSWKFDKKSLQATYLYGELIPLKHLGHMLTEMEGKK